MSFDRSIIARKYTERLAIAHPMHACTVHFQVLARLRTGN